MDLTAIIIVPTIFYFLYKFCESLIRRRERIELVQKLDLANLQALHSAEALNVLDYMPNKRFSGLRMGLLFTGAGLGLMVAWALALYFYPLLQSYNAWEYQRMFYAIYLASPAVFGGIGLITSYLIEQKSRK